MTTESPQQSVDGLPTVNCAICGDEIMYDLAGMPTHVSHPDDHEPVER